MITEMRKQFRSTATRIILLLISATLAISLIVPVFMRKQIASGPWVLRVNSHDVDYKDFAREVTNKRQLVASVRARFGANAEQLLASMGLAGDPRSYALDSMTYNELITQAAHESGIVIHEDYMLQKLHDTAFVSRQLADYVPPFVIKDGVIDQATLKESLRRQGMTLGEFEHKLHEILVRTIILETLSSTAYVPRFEKELNVTQELAKRSYAVLTFSAKDALKEAKKEVATEDELQKFFDEQNKVSKRYLISEKRAGNSWQFDAHHYGASVSMDDIVAYYDAHKSQKYIAEPTKITVRHIVLNDGDAAQSLHKELQENPTLFEHKARELSVDKESARQGGLVAVFARGQKEESFERAAFLLKNDGDISPVTKTAAGYEILQRVSRKNISYKSLESVQKEIKEALAKRSFGAIFAQDMKQVLADPKTASQEIARMVEEKKGTEQRLGLSALTNDRRVQELFVLKNNGYGFYLDGDKGVVVQLTALEKAHTPALSAVQTEVERDFYMSRAEKIMAAKAQEARTMLKDKTAQEVAHALGASLYQTPLITQGDTASQDELEKHAVSTSRLLALDRVGLVTSYQTADGLQVARLEKIEGQERKDSSKEQEIEKSLERENMQSFAQGILASLYRNATIETNPTLLQL